METESRNAKELHLGRQFSYDRIKSYHARFIDKQTGKFDKAYTEPRDCPVCAGESWRHIFDASGGSYVRCDNCSMVYLNPVFTRASLNLYYKDLDTGQARITQNESSFYREIYGIGLASIKDYANVDAILDIGCSGGFFLDLAKEQGWKTAGLEINREEAEICRQRGHRLFTDPLEECRITDSYNAITLWDVLEHIPDARSYLALLRTYLTEGGVVFVQTPNTDALAPRIMRAKCKMFDGVEHVNLYSPATLKRVAEAAGLAVVQMRTVISEIAVVNNYLSYDDPYFGSSDYGPLLAGIIDERALHERLLGYKIQAVLKKV